MPKPVSPRLCPQSELLLALGILSAPSYHDRRSAQRHSWMRWPNVGHHEGAAVCACFVVRAGGAPRGTAKTLRRESSVHGDMLLVSAVAHNESRVRGPVLSLASWLLHAAAELQHATFIGKLDDDAYVHAPDLEGLLHATHAQLGPSANVYLGVHTWYHWYERLFANTRHGWGFHQAEGAGRSCRATELRLKGACGAADAMSEGSCGTCVGPFAFAAGYLIVASRTLVTALVSSGSIATEARALQAMEPHSMLNHVGKPAESVMEDVWFGSVLHRYPLPSPVSYVTLLGGKGGTLFVDAWDFRIARTALLVHIITKQLERYLALHDLIAHHPTMHCSQPYTLTCVPECHTRAHGRLARAGRGPRPWPGRDCRRASADVADQWCTVHSAVPAKPSQRCCGLGPNVSCTKLIGSNSWPVPYRSQLVQLKKRFEPLPRANASPSGLLL